MGAEQSTEGVAVYGGGVAEPYAAVRGGFITGGDCGCGGFIGGGDGDGIKEMGKYSESAAARAKDEIIRSVTATVGSMFGMSLSSDPTEALAQIKAKIPDPRKGKSFKESADAQEKICQALAKGFNENITPGRKGHKRLIDTDGDASYVCRAVAELVDGLSTGMRVEFLDIQAELRRLIRNMEILLQITTDEGDAVEGKISASGDAELRRDASASVDRGARARAALLEQLTTLRLLLSSTVASAEQEMELALREKDETIIEVLKGLGMDPGSRALSDNIAGTMVGMGTVATMAKDLNEALKKVGMGVAAFFDAVKWADVDAASEPTDASANVGEILRAKEVLKKWFGSRGRKGLRAKMGGGCACGTDPCTCDDNVGDDGVVGGWGVAIGGAGGGDGDLADLARMEDAYGEAFVGGADSDDDDPTVAKLSNKLKLARKERILIVKTFIRKLDAGYKKILAAVKEIGPQIGKTIPVSRSLQDLALAMGQVGKTRTKYLELALIGMYPESARAQSLKASYLGTLAAVATAASAAASGPGAESFNAISAAVAEVERVVSFYGDVMAKREGGDGVTGGAGETPAEDLKAMTPILNTTINSIGEAIRLMRYYTFLATIRSNIDHSAKEIESYGEGYAEILGDAVAERLDNDNAKLDALKKLLTDFDVQKEITAVPGAPLSTGLYSAEFAAVADLPAVGGAGASDGTNAPHHKAFLSKVTSAALDRIEEVRKAKAGMYRVAQAVDQTLQTFTKNALRSPDALVKDLMRSLDETKVISRWYNDETGEEITKAFDELRSRQAVDKGNGVRTGDVAQGEKSTTHGGDANKLVVATAAGGHYYERVVAADGAAGATHVSVGNHFAAQILLPKDYEIVRGHVEKTFGSFQALKNLINVYARIGGSTGGTFMSPAEIYRALVNYLVVSSFRTPSIAAVNRLATHGAADGALPPALTANNLDAAKTQRLKQLMHFSFAPAFSGTYGDEDIGAMGFDHTTDLFFTTVKAMVAKVMSVLNLYKMMEKPSLLGSLSATRMILGGSATGGAVADVIPEAAGLYFHLPRLMEFYVDLFLTRHYVQSAVPGVGPGGVPAAPGDSRDPFGDQTGINPATGVPYAAWEGHKPGADTARLILLVPDAAGTFAELIKLYFTRFRRDDAGALKGQYGAGEGSDVIAAINNIHKHFSSGGADVVQSACRALVAEVNRRYGVVTHAQWTKMKELYEGFETEVSDMSDPLGSRATNYAILPGEEDDAAMDRPAPSDSYLTSRSGSNVKLKPRRHRFHLADSDWFMIRDLRERVSAYFAVGLDNYSATSRYVDFIEMKTAELARSSSADKKFGLAMSLLNSLGGSNGISNAIWMERLVFHETVLLPLATLQKIGRFVSWFVTRAHALKLAAASPGTLREILGISLALTTGGSKLVSCSIGRSNDSPVLLDFSGLQELTEQLAADVRTNLAKWRGRVADATLEAITGTIAAGAGAATYPLGSLGWVDDVLITQMFRGRLAGRAGSGNFTGVAVSQAIKAFTEAFAANLAAGGVNAVESAEVLMSFAVGNDNAAATAGAVAAGIRAAIPQTQLHTLLRHDQDIDPANGNLKQGGPLNPPNAAGAGGAVGHAGDIIWRYSGRSLFTGLNQCLAAMITVGYDDAARRIYSGLVRDLATGALAASVSLGSGATNGRFDDTSGNPQYPGRNGIGANSFDAELVVCRSVATMLKRLGSDLMKDKSSVYGIESLSDVAENVKERMRAFLPMIRARVDQVSAGALVLAQICSRLMTAAKTPDWLSRHLIAIQDAANATSAVLGRVIGELGDRPVFFETSPGAAEKYKQRYGKSPLLPASLGFTKLRFLAVDSADHLYASALGAWMSGATGQTTDEFQVTNALRGMYHGPGWMSGAGGFLEIFQGAGKPSTESYKQMLGRFESFLGFADGCVGAFGMFAGPNNSVEPFANLQALDGAAPYGWTAGEPAVGAFPMIPGTPTSLADVIVVADAESHSGAADSKIMIAGASVTPARGGVNLPGAAHGPHEAIMDPAANAARREEVRAALIDLNLVPINVHALMRGVPMASLFNYAFTFEEMSAVAMGTTRVGVQTALRGLRGDLVGGLADANTRDAFVDMLTYPRQVLGVTPEGLAIASNGVPGSGEGVWGPGATDPATFGLRRGDLYFGNSATRNRVAGLLLRLARGGDNLGMGRPKFVSDQLFNKALFVNIWPGSAIDEGGPGMASATVRNQSLTNPLALNSVDAAPGRNLTWQTDGAPGAAARRTTLPGGRLTIDSAVIGTGGRGMRDALFTIGRERFDTMFVRSLFVTSMLQRLMRFHLAQILTEDRRVVAPSHALVAPRITEFGVRETIGDADDFEDADV